LSGVWKILGPSPAPAAPALGPDPGGDLLEGLGREGGPHLVVAGLVAAHAGNRPDLREEAGAVAVDREIVPVEPLDLAVTAWDCWESLVVLGDTESSGTSESTEFYCGTLLIIKSILSFR
jgi:hypothetical protein